jgi:Ser/Thr protein kinase RdoA (MazF antagonist)
VYAFLASRPNWKEGVAVLEPGWNEVAAGLTELPEIWIHGDPQANNHFFLGEEVAAVIDFHLATVAPRLLDLAIALDRNGLLWLEIMAGNAEAWDEPSLRGLLEGYGPLTAAEANLLPRLLPLAQVDFALSLLTYYLTIERNEARAAWAWDVFVLGHARWHASASGQRLRADLTRWLSDASGRSTAPEF